MSTWITPTTAPHSLHLSSTLVPSTEAMMQPQHSTPAVSRGMIGIRLVRSRLRSSSIYRPCPSGFPIRAEPWKSLCRSRNASPAGVALTTERPSTCSFLTSPRSFASSQTGSFGHEVRHASMTSS
jgi:hypothetical protein